jgi:hypothetical protein
VLSVGASAVFALPYAIFIILFFLRFITTFACTFLNANPSTASVTLFYSALIKNYQFYLQLLILLLLQMG